MFFKASEANAKIKELEVKLSDVEDTAGKAVAELNGKLEGLSAQVTALTGERDSAKAELAETGEKFKAALAEVETLKAGSKNVDEAAEAKAQQILAGMGISTPLKKVEAGGDAKTKEQLWTEYNALPIEERNAFYAKHKKVLKS